MVVFHRTAGHWWRNGARFGARFPNGFSGQRRTMFAIPRLGLMLVRLPLAFGAAGAGATGYMYYKVNEFSKDIVPDWAKDALNQAKDWVSSIDLSNLDLDFSKLKIEPENVELPINELTGPIVSEAALPGMEEASKNLDQMTANVLNAKATPPGAAQQPAGTGPVGTGPDGDLMILTKKLIEVRNLLKTVDNNTNLQLPSIVVIGSQSSGKSSVLEAIVGHEFLPKGSNMVTRRPIELTLIHSPQEKESYSEFPQLGLGKVFDFKQVQKTLTDLNLAVSDEECISKKPIELRIYSPNVPDLTLVDLPGYIQISNKKQPPMLKEKIIDLCDQYIQEPNIILAVCAADVDLANSEALRASRKVDPVGERTIGVITKMDLVEPREGVSILKNTDYPLQLGYVGVVNKGGNKGAQALVRAENAFFESNAIYRETGCFVGTKTLRRTLMRVLEDHMGRGLYKVVDAVQSELEDARYQFKVQYNDRKISPASYVAEAMDSLKSRFKHFTKEFGKPQVRDLVRSMLEQRIAEICDEVYWTDPRIGALPKVCADPLWQTRVDLTSATLTKSGVGRRSVQLVVDYIMENMERMLSSEQWAHHPNAREQIMQFSNEILRTKFHTTVDQVENTIKPYKFEVECNELEWQEGVKRATAMLESNLSQAKESFQTIKSSLGRRKLRNAMRYLQKAEQAALQSDDKPDSPTPSKQPHNPFPPNVIEGAKEAVKLQNRIATLQSRLSAVRSRQCGTSANKGCCPEAFMEVVAEKLTYTAVMFIYVELLNEFFFQLPREIDNKLYYELTRPEIMAFAKENPSVAKHLEVQERKETLELVMEKLRSLRRGF
ncbi:dynamin-like GTPase mgm1 [Chytridiales sp. JEL 0842]|nr:dynamin-like GTPase mgm1 [Chytridiales sp. JEL 0842]